MKRISFLSIMFFLLPVIASAQEKLDDDVIRKVAVVNIRMAATLANINHVGGFKETVYTVHWTPVPLESIEPFLNRARWGDFFERYDREARRLNKLIEEGKLEEVVYKVDVDEKRICIRSQLEKCEIDRKTGDVKWVWFR